MDHVVISIYPFIMRQSVSAYQKGICVRHIECDNINNLANTAFALCKEFDIHKVDLAGVNQYCLKVRDDMNKLPNFDNFGLEFIIH